MKYDWNLVFAVYNAYNRSNAFSIYYRQDDPDKIVAGPGERLQFPNNSGPVRYSIFARIIPGITYNFKF